MCDTLRGNAVKNHCVGTRGGSQLKPWPKRRSRYAEDVQTILYKLGGCTTSQVARWLALLCPEIAERDRSARMRRVMTHPDKRSMKPLLPPSYRLARAVLVSMREAGEVEEMRIRRAWTGTAQNGRLENFYRLSRARGQESALDAGLVAGVEPEDARAGYRRIWSGGAILHTAQRDDVFALLCAAGRSRDDNEYGILVDAGSVWGESHPDYPLVGARKEALDAAGRKKYATKRGEKQKASRYTGRAYERVVPDGELVLRVPPLVTPSASNNDYEPYQDIQDSTPAREEYSDGWRCADSGEEEYA